MSGEQDSDVFWDTVAAGPENGPPMAMADFRRWAALASKRIAAAEQRGYERGRKEGIEEAAKVGSQFIDGRLYKPKMPACSYHSAELATAIRQLLEVKG
ncbi:hypothetical protein [Devosia sp. FJ2-5-3]|uniref:hypothetical protein n=1 Tax=Devosia sp. FJ2-5-3 TaxID=2976680 RepID=UPI0023D7DB63|nr:hypothetical protein [Devosia sp. FJ2-5-3]WEJ60181.1 hypothetical protein N0P34_09165 [Devosia sp. FJ2-5-3]